MYYIVISLYHTIISIFVPSHCHSKVSGLLLLGDSEPDDGRVGRKPGTVVVNVLHHDG